MMPLHYNDAKKGLYGISCLNPSTDQVAKHLKQMYKILCEDWGFLDRQGILIKMVNDTAEIGLSMSLIKQLLEETN